MLICYKTKISRQSWGSLHQKTSMMRPNISVIFYCDYFYMMPSDYTSRVVYSSLVTTPRILTWYLYSLCLYTIIFTTAYCVPCEKEFRGNLFCEVSKRLEEWRIINKVSRELKFLNLCDKENLKVPSCRNYLTHC